jgi:cysteine-rich repeat protein
MHIGFCTVAAASFGCATQLDEAEQSAHTPAEAAAGRLQLTFQRGDGTAAPNGIFHAKADVYLRTTLADKEQPLGDGDLAFTVTDGTGVELARDAIDCRRFRVAPGTGRIAEVYAGFDRDRSACRHGFVLAADGSLLLQLAPFADAAPNAAGVMELTVAVGRVEHLLAGAFGSTARATLLVEVVQENVCGDGQVTGNEECDDGNTTTGDGCSSDCKIEHSCSCGNGNLDAGEQCDDGNNVSGDGCSSDCKIEQSCTCGNGVVDAGEDCDDGNTTSGDGCSSDCKVELLP